MVKETVESLKYYLKDKLASPFYGTFIISWLLWNWKVWYVTFFIDSNLLFQVKNILKIDYVLSFYSWGYFWNITYFFVPPLISSYIIIFWLPKITCKFYEKSLENENVIKLIKLEKDRVMAEAEEKTFKAEEAKLDVEEKVLKKETAVNKIKSEISNEELWNREYEKFKSSKYFNDFNAIKSCLYNNAGKTSDAWGKSIVAIDIKAYSNVNGLIEMTSDKNNNEVISLTEKGRYFMKRYSEEN